MTGPAARLRRWLGLAVVLSLLAGCGGAASTLERTPGPSAPSLSYEQAVALVPVDGSPDRRLYWEIDPPVDPELAAAVTAAQHYEAAWQWLVDQPPPVPAEQLSVLGWFSLPEEAERQRGLLTAQLPAGSGEQLTGPRWISLLAAESERAGEAVVVMCVDTGWYTATGVEGDPRSPDRADLYAYQVVQRPAPDGVDRWQVWRSTINPMHEQDWFPDGASAWQQTCEQWATHDPDDAK